MSTTVGTHTGLSLPPEPRSRSISYGDPVRGTILISAEADQAVRWSPGERLDQLFEDRCDRLREQGLSGQIAVDAGEVVLTYAQLDARANQLARHLLKRGARPGDRIALLFDQPWRSYVAMLAVLKIRAAFVPLDAGFPSDRLRYIIEDADVEMVLSLAHLDSLLPEVAAPTVCIDTDEPAVDAESPARLRGEATGGTIDDLAYIIYTSGSTGRPKGVAVEHASICNFVRVAAESYGLEPTDRVYQGMTIAFDFSAEEYWVPWMVGATVVPKPGRSALLGAELAQYLTEKRVTAMCCVPTLLATIEEDLPGLRFLLVSGEACPKALITRWHRPWRRFLNVYGPTEATVTATWGVVDPDRPVTLGVPLPTYSVVILDLAGHRALAPGEAGEIGLAGIGLARGYVNRPDLTERAFIPDFLGIENNPSGRIYRTGDLGRVAEDGEVEYLGRIDTQVKIRGYRIELTEIESSLLQVPEVAQAVVQNFEPEEGKVELAAYYTLHQDATGIDAHDLHRALRTRLPSYMVPTYYEQVDSMPMMASDKVDRKRLPRPTHRLSVSGTGPYSAPATPTEEALAVHLAAVLGLERVSAESHFFNDLGADSLTMAHFCARVRKGTDLPWMAMQDIYERPTIRQLAARLAAMQSEQAQEAPAFAEAGSTITPAGTGKFVLCGVLQVLIAIVYSMYVMALPLLTFEWIVEAPSLVEFWARAAAVGAAEFTLLAVTPILLKWVLVGRFRPGEIQIWSLAYLRFWAVKSAVRANPLMLFAGAPIHVLYLRLLGAKIGKGVVIFSRRLPACPDLLTIGDGTVINKDSAFTCYRARSGVIEFGTLTLGRNVYVSERTTLDIGASMGDDSQLGHASSLQTGQAVPAGEVWHGSPAARATTQYRRVPAAACGTVRRVVYSLFQLAGRILVVVPLGFLVLDILLPAGLDTDHPEDPAFILTALSSTFVFFVVVFVGGLILVVTIPRVLEKLVKPDVVYPLYGWHYSIHRTIASISNIPTYKNFFGDSSYIVYYLQALGYKLGTIVQTGSNFGPTVAHESPFLCTVGTGTMVSDGLNMMTAQFSSTSFRLREVRIGARNFLGNNITFPSDAAVGDNVLLASKVMIPIDGPVRTDTGLLGSPAFEIPRSVLRDAAFDELKTDEERRRVLPAKNRYNIGSMALYLVEQWFMLFLGVLVVANAVSAHSEFGLITVVPALFAFSLFQFAFKALVEWSVLGFHRLQPQYFSIYDRRFWRHERLWKLMGGAHYAGTPFRPIVWRILGVHVGKRLYDAGCNMPEKSLVTFGDDCALNEGVHIQGHSMEDGAFKTDYIVLGNGCTVGVDGWLNYGAVMEDGSTLAADGMLMKGEDVPEGATFVGNPARAAAAPHREVASASARSDAALGLAPRATRKAARETVTFRRFSKARIPLQ
ncbi:Pls/PosA family non-ribosomal peptide synthetase [Planctomonas deserti]|uniref:Pls/PosA family non-ribosomal peptide synthetase n=1 Tax=Planctomonas deserti TaxID=2144185 RepID=UPI000D35A4F9|nr:Pls/PosA family non-ribosomal peptide synthetase [Planctomonas deserti]